MRQLFIFMLTLSFCYLKNNEGFGQATVEEGVARYYAADFNGKHTSFGEVYDDSQLTASHSKYPLNTYVKVTNLGNGKTIEVRINDKCNCEKEGKIINLSREAASRLGMIAAGKADVMVELIPKDALDSRASLPIRNNLAKTINTNESFSANHTYDISGKELSPQGFAVQVTAVGNLNSIKDLYNELLHLGLTKDEIFVQVGLKEGSKVYRILFGEYQSRDVALEKTTWLSEHGYKGVIRTHLNL
jgi:rare lipoprotein A